MAGAIIMVLFLIFIIPMGILMAGGLLAAVIGHVARGDADTRHAGSELIDLNG